MPVTLRKRPAPVAPPAPPPVPKKKATSRAKKAAEKPKEEGKKSEEEKKKAVEEKKRAAEEKKKADEEKKKAAGEKKKAEEERKKEEKEKKEEEKQAKAEKAEKAKKEAKEKKEKVHEKEMTILEKKKEEKEKEEKKEKKEEKEEAGEKEHAKEEAGEKEKKKEKEKEREKEKEKEKEKDQEKQIAVGETIHLEGFGGEIQLQDGEKTTLKKLVHESKAGVVLFTYPKASTPGCTQQACLFRDSYEPLTADGLAIYGLSSDSPKANTTFKEKQKLPYPLLCDPDFSLIAAIGLKKQPKGTQRGVFAVNKEGKVLVAEAGGPAATVDRIKALVEELKKK